MKSVLPYSRFRAIRQAWSSSRGVTLFELLTVIALIGILAVLTLPGLQGILERAKFNNAKDDIINAMTIAHNKALANVQDESGGATDCHLNGDGTYVVYFASYRFFTDNPQKFYAQAVRKRYDNTGNKCYSDADTMVRWKSLVNATLPSSMHFDLSGYGHPTVWYSTTASEVTLEPSPFQLKLIDTKLPSDNIYYFCVDGSGVPRAQKSPCF